LKAAAPDVAPPVNAGRLLAAGCEVFVEGLIDPEAERQRKAKHREELQKQEAALAGRLSNAAYLAKAPPHLVQQTKDQLAAVRAELAKS
jgi:valyl-tRNA synthetase